MSISRAALTGQIIPFSSSFLGPESHDTQLSADVFENERGCQQDEYHPKKVKTDHKGGIDLRFDGKWNHGAHGADKNTRRYL
jgi:hypothetical protein